MKITKARRRRVSARERSRSGRINDGIRRVLISAVARASTEARLQNPYITQLRDITEDIRRLHLRGFISLVERTSVFGEHWWTLTDLGHSAIRHWIDAGLTTELAKRNPQLALALCKTVDKGASEAEVDRIRSLCLLATR